MIIVEGVDHTGKTTLMNQLMVEFSDYKLTSHKSPDKNMERPSWWARELLTSRHERNRIYDRFFFSEFVYGPPLRGKTCMSDSEEELLWSFIDHIKPFVILCQPPETKDLKPIEHTEQMEGVIENYRMLADRYNTVIKPMLDGHRIGYMNYKFTDPEAWDIVKVAVKLHLMEVI